MAALLQSFDSFDLWEEELDDVENFTKFVFGVYYEHHWQWTNLKVKVCQIRKFCVSL